MQGEKREIKGSSSFGCYVFHDVTSSDKTGDLEDLLLLLMNQERNRGIFEKAYSFLNDGRNLLIGLNEENKNRDKEYDPLYDRYTSSHKYKAKKSWISVAGQLQLSGMQNAVIILKSDYITKQDILENDECSIIASLFR